MATQLATPAAPTAYEAYVAALVAKAPPLTAHQTSRLTVLLSPPDAPAAEVPRQRRAA